MKRSSYTTVLIILLAAFACMALLAPDASAQCAMCRTGVEAGGEKSVRAMGLAMLVLLIPPVAIFCSAFALVYKYRKPNGDEEVREHGGE
ncbi:MAG TPA: hypothetical protein VGV59_21000 [Pyrinomonadaceae bacterium]|nr:hypothetical protein [Pyrinomonadaceae bacterium]